MPVFVFALILFLFSATGSPAAPVIYQGGIVHAADNGAQIPAGSIFSIYGTDLGPANPVIASTKPLPISLAGVSVLVTAGGQTIECPLFFVYSGQINAQMPFGLDGEEVDVQVRGPSGDSDPTRITVWTRKPALFTKSMDGNGEAIVLHADFSLVSEESPARPGEIVILYVSGLGPVSPAIPAGVPAGDGGGAGPLNVVTSEVELRVGGIGAQFYWAGIAPYFVGAYQVNFGIPENVPLGPNELVVISEDVWSQLNVTVFIGYPEQVVGTGSASSSGGSVTGGGASAIVPAGALDSTVSLALYQSSEPIPPAASPVFRLAGLPDDFDQPITITLPLTVPPAGGRAFLAVRDENGGAGPLYFDASVNGNSLTAQIPSLPAPDGATASKSPPSARLASGEIGRGFTLWAIAGWYASTSPSGKFEMLYPSADLITGVADDLLLTLDDAYSKLEGLGLNWNGRTTWPIRCVLEEFTGSAATRVAEERPDKRGDNYAQLGFNQTLLGSDSSGLGRTTTGHELFHILQRLYDPRDRYTKARSPGEWLWFDEAASTWFERRMSSNSSYLSFNVQNENYRFLRRRNLEFAPGDSNQVQDHGYGASLFLEHLSTANGDTIIGDIVKLRAAAGSGIFGSFLYSPVAAIDSAVGDVSMAWRRFCEKYMAGTLYSGQPAFPVPANIIAGATVLRFAENDLTQTLTYSAGDLSAHVFTLDFRQESLQWPDDMKLKMNLTESDNGSEAIVYRYRSAAAGGEVWERVGIFYDDFEMEDVMSWIDDGIDLVVMVANGRASKPYTGSQSITFTVNAESDSQVQTWEQSNSGLFYNNEWTVSYTAKVSSSGNLVGCEHQVGGSFMILNCFLPQADTNPPTTDTYTIELSVGGVSPVNPNIVPSGEDWEMHVFAGFNENWETGGTATKTILAPRGQGEYSTSGAVLVYYINKKTQEERWMASGTLFRFYMRNP